MRESIAATMTLASRRQVRNLRSPTGPQTISIRGYDYVVAGSGWFGSGLMADLKGEITALNAEIQGFVRTYLANAERSPDKDKLYDYYQGYINSFLKSWNEFASEHQNWYNNMWWTYWSSCQDFRKQFINIVEGARKIGYDAPVAPTPVKENDLYRTINRLDDAGTAMWGTLKYVIVFAIGAIALTMIFVALGSSTHTSLSATKVGGKIFHVPMRK